MKNKEKKDFRFLRSLCRTLSPVCRVLFWICVAVAAILAVVCIIVPIVKVPAADMLLPPFMKLKAVDDTYEISLGNGILISSAASSVTLDNIKTAIYCGIAIAEAVLIVLLPILANLGALLMNIGEDRLFDLRNAKYVKYIGLTILIGNTAVLFINRFFNYYLVKTFLSSSVRFRAGLDLIGIVMGLLVLLIGAIYGYTIRMCGGGMGTIEVSGEEVPPQYPVPTDGE